MPSVAVPLYTKPPPGPRADFKLASDFEPAGDQPAAIKELVAGMRDDERDPDRPPGVDYGAEQDTGRSIIRRDEIVLSGERG